MRLKEKISLITGAAKGIGKAIAMCFAKEGSFVIVNDIKIREAQKVVKEIVSHGGQAEAFQSDISKVNEVRNMIKKILKKFGRIDVLVNNAGICERLAIEDITSEQWDRTLDINLKGAFLCSQTVFKIMKSQRSGKIINIASLAGKVGGINVGAHYSASKAGIICLTKSFAKEGASYGITVNAVAPGVIDTDITTSLPKKEIESYCKSIPLRRIGEPEEVAELVLFLASNSSNYITGETIDINGGMLID